MDLSKVLQYHWRVEGRIAGGSWVSKTLSVDFDVAVDKMGDLKIQFPNMDFRLVSEDYDLTQQIQRHQIDAAKTIRFSDAPISSEVTRMWSRQE